MKHKAWLKKACEILCVSAFWIAVWAVLSLKVNSTLLFPSPTEVLRALAELTVTASFWKSTLLSLLRVILGIAVSLAAGSVLAVITERSKLIRTVLSPILGIIKATPVASFIILALLWINRSFLPIFIIALIVIPIVWSNVSAGIRSVDKKLDEVSRVYKFGKKDRLFKLYLPSVVPFFTAACRSALGMAWKAGISAEVLSTPQNAIGTELYFSKTYLETPSLFAWTAVIIVMSVIFEKLFVTLLEKLGGRLRFSRREAQK